MLPKKVVSIVILNGDDVDMKRVSEVTQNKSFTEEFHPVISVKPMKFGSIEQMVQVLETILKTVKESMPEQEAENPDNPLYPTRGREE